MYIHALTCTWPCRKLKRLLPRGNQSAQLARGKSSGSAATSGTPVPKPVPGASPPKVQQGQWKTKPTAVVSGVGTSKEAMAGAGADALALMPHIPTAPATAPSEAGAASASASHHADAAPAAQGISTPTAKALDMHRQPYSSSLKYTARCWLGLNSSAKNGCLCLVKHCKCCKHGTLFHQCHSDKCQSKGLSTFSVDMI